MALGLRHEVLLRVKFVDVNVADVAHFGLRDALAPDVLLKIVTCARLECFAVGEGAFFKFHLGTVLQVMSFAFSILHGLVAKVAPHFQTRKLIQDYALHLGRLENFRCGATPIRTTHPFRDMAATKHVIAGLFRAADRIVQDLETNAAH